MRARISLLLLFSFLVWCVAYPLTLRWARAKRQATAAQIHNLTEAGRCKNR